MELSVGTGAVLYYAGVTVASLLPIANPFSTSALFLAITPGLSADERNQQAFRAGLYMAAILLIFLVAGALIMRFFGISVSGVRIAGGLVVSFIGFRMLFPQDDTLTEEGRSEATLKHDVAFTPLAMPSLAGPGSIAVILGIAAEIERPIEYIVVGLGIVLTAIVCWLVLRAAGTLVDFLGQNGIDAVARIMGFLLICIGVQFVAFGVRDFIIDPAFWSPTPMALPVPEAPPPG
ncbi:MAG: MarC family NAAT transporter [Candidatus Binatia bacterium]|nr:MarC family NAAT transporter [Candidatus Binatia bacterium]